VNYFLKGAGGMARKKKHEGVRNSGDGWIEKEVERKRREKEALAMVFGEAQESRQKDLDTLKELMKKEEQPPEEKGGPLYTPLSRDLDTQVEKKKAISKVFSNEQEAREKQRQALKSWILGGEEKK
jgi:hypothetical protein